MPSASGPATRANGKVLFTKTCATCHTLFGEGNKVGPDLTGADRKNRDFLLTSIVDPSAYIRPEFVAYVVNLKDGRALTGLMAESSPKAITLLDDKNERTVIARDKIDDLAASPVSLMPEKILDPLSEQEIRDLFAYLQARWAAEMTCGGAPCPRTPRLHRRNGAWWLRAGDPAGPQAAEALAALCDTYWYPIYAYLRRRTGNAETALDLTQGFFADLLARNALSAADPARGKFRTFLLRCCDNYLANQRNADRAQKRGGGQQPLPLDFATADERYRREPADLATPESLYRRRWAMTLLETTFALIEQDYERDGHGDLYRMLRPTLTAEANAPGYAAVAAALGMTEAALKKAAQRLRQRYGESLRQQIASTVEGPEQVEEEIRELFAAVAP